MGTPGAWVHVLLGERVSGLCGLVDPLARQTAERSGLRFPVLAVKAPCATVRTRHAPPAASRRRALARPAPLSIPPMSRRCGDRWARPCTGSGARGWCRARSACAGCFPCADASSADRNLTRRSAATPLNQADSGWQPVSSRAPRPRPASLNVGRADGPSHLEIEPQSRLLPLLEAGRCICPDCHQLRPLCPDRCPISRDMKSPKSRGLRAGFIERFAHGVEIGDSDASSTRIFDDLDSSRKTGPRRTCPGRHNGRRLRSVVAAMGADSCGAASGARGLLLER
jgi:hypothetical protein